MIADDLYQVGDNETLQSGSGSCLSADFMDGNSYRSIHTNETLLISTDDEVERFFADDNATLPSYTSSHILDEAFENDEIDYKNPIYNDCDYNFSLTDVDSNVLNNVMKYSLNKQDDDNDEKIEVSISSDLEFKIERPIIWTEFINYYWIGLFNNLKHKRKYVEYCNQVLNFKKKVNVISQKISVNNTTNIVEQEKTNYFNIENYDVNSYDNKSLFSTSESNLIFTEIEELFNMIDKLLTDDIIFMKNSKAPIGDFFNRYNSIKNDCLKLSNIKNNKIFNNARCSTEIKQYKNSKSIRRIKDKFTNENPVKDKKEFERKFKDDLIKDKQYIEKDKFLYSLKEWMKSIIFKQKEENYEMILKYYNRQQIYFTFIETVYSIYCQLKTISQLKTIPSDILLNTLNPIKKYLTDYNNGKTIDEKKQEYQQLATSFKECIISKDEYIILNYEGSSTNKIAINKCFWTYRNKNMIKDIHKLIGFLNDFDVETEIVKQINILSKDYLRDLLKDEKEFEEFISNWYEKNEKEKKVLYKSNIFSEKEVWWYYFVYNLDLYYADETIDYETCCYPNGENYNIESLINNEEETSQDIEKGTLFINEENSQDDMEKGTLINNEEESPDDIKIFLESKSYLSHSIAKKRPKYPLYKNFKWDKLEFNKDKIDFSRRQLQQNKYFIEKLNNELINNELKQIGELNESYVRKNFILESIENIEEVLNELENMGNFIKEGVLLNEQLFFKLVLFGINILIFIGQYFWNNHIKPTI
jgi:predicted secreted protein